MISKETIARRMQIRKRMTKGEAHSVYKAIGSKKRMPEISEKKHSKNPEYAKMSIEEYEKKYL